MKRRDLPKVLAGGAAAGFAVQDAPVEANVLTAEVFEKFYKNLIREQAGSDKLDWECLFCGRYNRAKAKFCGWCCVDGPDSNFRKGIKRICRSVQAGGRMPKDRWVKDACGRQLAKEAEA